MPVPKPIAVMTIAFVLNQLSACGGGGGSNTAPAASSVSAPAQVAADPLVPKEAIALAEVLKTYGIESSASGGDAGGDGGAAGAAGDGGPTARAVVKLSDIQGNVVEGLTDSNGKFLLKFDTAKFKPPYLLRVIDSGGNVRTSVIREAIAANTAVWANVNPMTDKVVSDILDTSVGGTDKEFNASKLKADTVDKAKADLATSVRSALVASGYSDTSKFDPVRSYYNYDGKGVDAVLESLGHTRDSATGATQLRSKLLAVSNDANGTETTALVTATVPLQAAVVPTSESLGLTFAKFSKWMNEMNRCLALSATAYAADANCMDSDGSRLVRLDYKSNSKDFREDFRTLFSESDGSAVRGSSIRNAHLLFVGSSNGSTTTDISIVEFTIQQPYIGPLGPDGAVAGAVEYPVVAVFKQQSGLTRALASNWLLYGNQLNYDFSIYPRYFRYNQANPARQTTVPSHVHSSLFFSISPKTYVANTKSYADANIRAVRVLGPGLPSTGIVLAPSASCGHLSSFAILNKTGVVPLTNVATSLVQLDYRLASVGLNGLRFATPGTFFAAADSPYNAIPYVTDFSPIRAYSLYKFEVYFKSNLSNIKPDAIEMVRIHAPLVPPELVLNLPMNNVQASIPLVSLGAPGLPVGSKAVVKWTNNSFAAPVRRASLLAYEWLFGANQSTTLRSYLVVGVSPAAYSVGSVPSSLDITIPAVDVDPYCSSGGIPSHDGVVGNYREVTLTSFQGRARIHNSLAWSN